MSGVRLEGGRLEGEHLRSPLRVNQNFLKKINLILSVQSYLKKYSAFAVGQIISTSSPRPVPTKGRFAIVTDVRRDAVDAAVSHDERR